MKPRHHLNLNRQISQTLASHIIHIVLTIRLFSQPLSLLSTFGRLRAFPLLYSAPWQIKRPPQLMALMALVLHQSSTFPLLRALTCSYLPTIKGTQNCSPSHSRHLSLGCLPWRTNQIVSHHVSPAFHPFQLSVKPQVALQLLRTIVIYNYRCVSLFS